MRGARRRLRLVLVGDGHAGDLFVQRRAGASDRMRRSRPIQSDTVSLPASPGSGARSRAGVDVEAGLAHEAVDLVAREAEPAMGMVVAQALVAVRREIDDDAAGRPAAARAPPRAARGTGSSR